MKKLTTLLFVLVFASSMAFAQNNDATVDQTGNDHEASISQMGQMNEAYLDQTDGGGGSSGDATADIEQDGEGNYVNLSQRAFYGFPDESHATIVQVGDNNSVEGTSGSEAFYQNQPGGVLDVTMVGDKNTLYSLRTEAQKNGNEFLLGITGDENMVGIEQENASGDVDITGDGNDVTLSQFAYGAAFNPAEYNEATVDQFGDDNTADIHQRGVDNSASQWVAGNTNTVTQTQHSSDNSQRVEIEGDYNTYTVTQEGGTLNSLYVNSRGTGPGANSSEATNSAFTATQDGSGNLVSGSMGGDNNSLAISQDGNNNMIDGGSGFWSAQGFTIQGDNNVASITQSSNGNSATLNIMGSGNSATISQN